MLKFSEYPYQPIDIEKISKDLSSYISEFKNAKNAKKQIEIIQKINDYRSELEPNRSIAMFVLQLILQINIILNKKISLMKYLQIIRLSLINFTKNY